MSAYSYRYWSSGKSGTPVVLIHGLTGNAESWRKVAPLLGSKRTVVAVNLPGHDPATPFEENGDFEDMVNDLAVALRAADLYESHIVGYSLGARVGLGLLIRHPKLVGGATLIGVNPGARTRREREERRGADEKWADLLKRKGIEAFVDQWERIPLFASQATLPKADRQNQRAVRLGHNAAALASALRTLGLGAMPNYWPELSNVKIPIHIIVGERDRKFLQIARRMATQLKRGTVQTIPGSGHNVVLEAPVGLAGTILAHCDRRERVSP